MQSTLDGTVEASGGMTHASRTTCKNPACADIVPIITSRSGWLGVKAPIRIVVRMVARPYASGSEK
jgi:hypothetical protein